ncbi:hypothetical protein [Paenisporosarcina sp. NPDC076898]|uniref:hypothetical protein n=1 Tax=unclassified Paenisporosarcina TaxID=2642018 RepID=UPI003D057C15
MVVIIDVNVGKIGDLVVKIGVDVGKIHVHVVKTTFSLCLFKTTVSQYHPLSRANSINQFSIIEHLVGHLGVFVGVVGIFVENRKKRDAK